MTKPYKSWPEKASEIIGSWNTVDTCYRVVSDRDQDFYHDGDGVYFKKELRTRAYELAYRLSAEGYPSRVEQVRVYTELSKNPTFDDKTISTGP